jgi:exonuclease III
MALLRASTNLVLYYLLLAACVVLENPPKLKTRMELPKLTYACLNCISLNMSTLGSVNHLLKIYGIVSLKSDIIFLSDIRLCNSSGTSDVKKIAETFKINPYGSYGFFHNSRMNKRGVGILINNKINFSVTSEDKDPDDNFLGLKVEIQGTFLYLCSVYGPNKSDPQFFARLRSFIEQSPDYNIIIGGDWNCTWSCLNNENNIDILNMQTAPNARHSVLLKKICSDLNLTDPFRIKFPFKRDFSYSPSNTLLKYRSRLDFFIVSTAIVDQIKKMPD